MKVTKVRVLMTELRDDGSVVERELVSLDEQEGHPDWYSFRQKRPLEQVTEGRKFIGYRQNGPISYSLILEDWSGAGVLRRAKKEGE